MGWWAIWGHHWPLANLGSPSGRPTGHPLSTSEFTRTLTWPFEGSLRDHSDNKSGFTFGPKSPSEVLKCRGQSSLGQTRLQSREHLFHQSERRRRGSKTVCSCMSPKMIPVGDAWTASLGQFKSIFQLFNCISVTATPRAMLASQLMTKTYILMLTGSIPTSDRRGLIVLV